MSLIKCAECGKEVSDKAATCPNCGYPIKPDNIQKPAVELPPKPKKKGHGCLVSMGILLFLFIGLCIIVSQGVEDMKKKS